MRIGILQADTVSPALASRHGDYPEMFRRLLVDPQARREDLPLPEFAVIDAGRSDFPDPSDCDAYLVTGSRHSVYDDVPWIPRLAEFVAAALARRRRVVGICFGHQLIAHFFGGRTSAAANGWGVGVHTAEIVHTEPWMDPPARRLRLLVSHQDQVVQLPAGARLFAVSDHCPIAGFVMDDAMTLQGHPEFTPAYAGDLMDARRQAVGEALYLQARRSLDQDTDAPLAARWMLRFLRS